MTMIDECDKLQSKVCRLIINITIYTSGPYSKFTINLLIIVYAESSWTKKGVGRKSIQNSDRYLLANSECDDG